MRKRRNLQNRRCHRSELRYQYTESHSGYGKTVCSNLGYGGCYLSGVHSLLAVLVEWPVWQVSGSFVGVV